jgi:prepilin-type N-terminal cleavage/methylation domain-containing protein
MQPTFTAQTRVKGYLGKCVYAKMRDYTDVSRHRRIRAFSHLRKPGFTVTELVIVIVVLGVFVLLTVTNLFGLLRRNRFEVQAHEFVSVMQMAAAAAAESDRRYEVIIDLTEQSYTLRQITSPDLFQVLEEDIIATNEFGMNCQVLYVLFDDLMETDEDHQVAKFRAGHAGWQYGGKIVLLDEQEQPYSVLVSRMSRVVTLKKGDVEFLLPRAKDEVLF